MTVIILMEPPCTVGSCFSRDKTGGVLKMAELSPDGAMQHLLRPVHLWLDDVDRASPGVRERPGA